MADHTALAGEDPILAPSSPTDGVGLCLSGGGYRAMLFHVGALWRLMEAGKLLDLTRISSVSGGSITAGVLALAWGDLARGGGMAVFQRKVVDPLRGLAATTIDERSVIGGILLPGTIGSHVARAYAKHLFGEATLQDLPETPRFVFNATNLETGTLFRFSRKEARDWRVGRIAAPTIRIADAVAASSAFPPVLSPFILDVTPGDFDAPAAGEIADDSFRSEISLSDGGVYDNLGLEQVWKSCRTVLVSDGGGRLADDSSPPGDWARQAMRVMEVIDHQVRNLRKRQMIGSLAAGERLGAYWGIRTDIADYGLGDEAVPAPFGETLKIAEIATRLKRMDAVQQERLINWGYAVSDAAIRRYWGVAAPRPGGLPYPGRGPGG
jgi:NTE family protein